MFSLCYLTDDRSFDLDCIPVPLKNYKIVKSWEDYHHVFRARVFYVGVVRDKKKRCGQTVQKLQYRNG